MIKRFVLPPFLGGRESFMEVLSDSKLSKLDKIIINVMNTIGWVAVLIAGVTLMSIVLQKELSLYNTTACAISVLVGLVFIGLSSIWPISLPR
jgi:hypothetical protein